MGVFVRQESRGKDSSISGTPRSPAIRWLNGHTSAEYQPLDAQGLIPVSFPMMSELQAPHQGE